MPPTLIREAGFVLLWVGAAANVIVYTFKAYVRTYTAPPLRVYQGGSGGGGVVHTATQIAPLPSPAEQAKQIARQGYVTDNVIGSTGTTKPVR